MLSYEYSLCCADQKLPWLSAKHIVAYVMASRSKLPSVVHLQECLKVFLLSQHRTLLYLCLLPNVNEYMSCQMKLKMNSRNGEWNTVFDRIFLPTYSIHECSVCAESPEASYMQLHHDDAYLSLSHEISFSTPMSL